PTRIAALAANPAAGMASASPSFASKPASAMKSPSPPPKAASSASEPAPGAGPENTGMASRSASTSAGEALESWKLTGTEDSFTQDGAVSRLGGHPRTVGRGSDGTPSPF